MGWRRSGVARSRTAASGRRSARRLHDRSSRGRSDHAQLGGRHRFSTADDLLISAGCEDGNDANALRRDPMFKMALDLSPSIGNCARSRQYRGWRICRTFAPCCGWAERWSICIASFRHGSQTDHAGHRRHVRCDPRWSAVAAVQRPLRRIGISVDRRVRRRGSLRHRRASSRQAAERQGDQALLRRLSGAIRAHWPNTAILARGPTAAIAVPRFSIGVAPMASITSPASRQPRHCA